MILAQLIRAKSAPGKFATATPATSATETPETDESVANVATVAVACSIREISDATNAVQWKKLEAATIQCCNARGDSDEHRAALLVDCLREEPADWGWWTNYFEQEMRR